MEALLCWVKNNLLDLLVAVGTLGAAYFAYRSAKMSEMANKAQFSPILIPSDFTYIGAGSHRVNGQDNNSYFSFKIKNNSDYHNAFAKNIQIYIEGEMWFSLETLNPCASTSPQIENIKEDQVLCKEIHIKYEDLLGNRFETQCFLSGAIIKKSPIHSDSTKIEFDWRYKQK